METVAWGEPTQETTLRMQYNQMSLLLVTPSLAVLLSATKSRGNLEMQQNRNRGEGNGEMAHSSTSTARGILGNITSGLLSIGHNCNL